MKNQALFSLKDISKKLKCRLLQFLFGALRVKGQDKKVCFRLHKILYQVCVGQMFYLFFFFSFFLIKTCDL